MALSFFNYFFFARQSSPCRPDHSVSLGVNITGADNRGLSNILINYERD